MAEGDMGNLTIPFRGGTLNQPESGNQSRHLIGQGKPSYFTFPFQSEEEAQSFSTQSHCTRLASICIFSCEEVLVGCCDKNPHWPENSF